MIRFTLLLSLLVLAPAASAAGQGEGSDLDRLSSTDGILGGASRKAAPSTETQDALPPGTPAPAPSVPVDGGLVLLAVAGAGFAARRFRARRA